MAKTAKPGESRDPADEAKHEETKKPTFSVDRKGESSAGALKPKDKERAVAADRDGSNTR
jgi:hypothetical protein